MSTPLVSFACWIIYRQNNIILCQILKIAQISFSGVRPIIYCQKIKIFAESLECKIFAESEIVAKIAYLGIHQIHFFAREKIFA